MLQARWHAVPATRKMPENECSCQHLDLVLLVEPVNSRCRAGPGTAARKSILRDQKDHWNNKNDLQNQVVPSRLTGYRWLYSESFTGTPTIEIIGRLVA